MIKESIGIYANGESSALVHVAPNGKVLDSISGPLSTLAGLVKAHYKGSIVYRNKDSNVIEFEEPLQPNLTLVSAMPFGEVFFRNLVIPVGKGNKMDEGVIYSELQKTVPWPIEKVVWDYCQNGPVDEVSMEGKIRILVVGKSYLESYTKELGKENIHPSIVTPSTEALAMLMEEKQKPNILVCQEGDRYLFMASYSGGYWARSIPKEGDFLLEFKRSTDFCEASQHLRGGVKFVYHAGLDEEIIKKLAIDDREIIKELSYSDFAAREAAQYIALGTALVGLEKDGPKIDFLRKKGVEDIGLTPEKVRDKALGSFERLATAVKDEKTRLEQMLPEKKT